LRVPEVELPPGVEAIGAGADAIGNAARPWLSARLAALLVSFGVPGGIAGVAAGAIVYLAMRRGRKRLAAEIERLKRAGASAPAAPVSDAHETSGVVERHHNRYVPYELTVLDKAWASAHAHVGEKYPGAIPYLKMVEGVKDQLLSGTSESPAS
jgi:hypothetical protein